MTKNKKALIVCFAALILLPFLALTISADSARISLSVILAAAAAVIHFTVKKRNIHSMNKYQVLGILTLIAVMYVMLYYVSGIFFGFSRLSQSFLGALLVFILPISVTVVSLEIIRNIALAQESRAISALSYVLCVVVETVVLSPFVTITTFNRFMDMFGLTLVPAVVGNFTYHYIAKRYGPLPNIAFRLITSLYIYIVGITAFVPDAILALAKIFVPLIIHSFIHALYERKRHHTTTKKERFAVAGVALSAISMIFVVMLISCQFKYGVLIVATESMSDEINKGDAVIYEQYDGGYVAKGQVIVFKKSDSLIIHRVVDIENIDGVTRYYTKGDANEDIDAGYITSADIVGLSSFKISYIGYPSVWLQGLFS